MRAPSQLADRRRETLRQHEVEQEVEQKLKEQNRGDGGEWVPAVGVRDVRQVREQHDGSLLIRSSDQETSMMERAGEHTRNGHGMEHHAAAATVPVPGTQMPHR